MVQVCCYSGCGFIYGEKEPLSDNRITHGLCPKHFEISLKEIKAERGGEFHDQQTNVQKKYLRTERGKSSGQNSNTARSVYGGGRFY
jgi:hypothetical protein